MKKEKKVRTYQRRTKSGKTVTVRAHTASYEAAEKAKEAAKKKGAGEELSSKAKKGEEWKLPMDEFLKKLKDERAQKREDEEPMKVEDEKPKKKSKKKTEKNSLSENTIKKRTVGTGTNGPELKRKTTTKKMVAKTDDSEPAFTRDEFKEWYRGTGSAADKKVAKALRKQLGRSGYNKFEDEAINNYTSRGHLSMFKRVSGGSSTSAKTTDAKVTKDKVSTPKKENYSAEVKRELSHQKKYVQHILKLSSKDPAMKSYIAAESKILSALKSYNGPIKNGSELMDSEKALAKKHGLIYDGDGEYRDKKSGKMYRISTSPITGTSTLHPLTGYLSGATTKQLRQAGFKGKDESTIDYDKLRKIIWGGTKKDSTSKVSTPTNLISEQSLNSKGFKTFKMPQIGTLYLGKAGKGAYIKFKGKKNIQKADIDDYEDFITGHDGLTKAQKKQLSSLGYTEHEEYGTSSKSRVQSAPKKTTVKGSKPTLSKSTSVTISKVPKSDRNKIISYVERATEGEYSSGKYTWKDTLAALRHPSESTVREKVERMYGVKVDGLKRDDGSKKRSVGTGTNGPEPKKSSAVRKRLTSAQAHAVNALLDKPGWNMKNAEAYVRTLSPKEVNRLLR